MAGFCSRRKNSAHSLNQQTPTGKTAVKRQWVIYFDGNLNTPWIARSDRGANIFFGVADALVRFLIDGGLDVEAIRSTIRTVEAGARTMVMLEDRPTGAPDRKPE